MMPDPYPVIWGNKGLAFITWLGAFLLKARPESILEIGGGRTTTTFYDYAFRFQKQIVIVTIEQSTLWVEKLRDDLCFLKIEDPVYLDSIHHVPLQESENGAQWYDGETFDTVVAERHWDLVFVDGPTGEIRQNADGQRRIMQAAESARLVIVDDVQRPYNLDLFWRITDSRFWPSDRLLYPYAGRENVLAMALYDDWAVIARSIFAFLGLEYWRCCTHL